jgi:hypothetical protein
MDIKKALLWAGIGAVGITGLLSAFIFLFGNFGDTEIKLILTTLTVGWFGMTASLSMRESKEPLDLVQAGAAGVISLLGVLDCLSIIWGNWRMIEIEDRWKLSASLITLSFALAWVAQIRPSTSSHLAVFWTSLATLCCVVMAETMMLMLIYSNADYFSEMFFRLLATVTVLAVIGSIIRPMVRKATQKDAKAAS